MAERTERKKVCVFCGAEDTMVCSECNHALCDKCVVDHPPCN